MSADAPTTGTVQVTLIRLGIGKEEFTLPEGATLADLRRESEADLENAAIFIDGKALPETVTLDPGTIVVIAPREAGVAGQNRWQGTVGMFRDDPLFDEMVEAGRAFREAERAAARVEGESPSS